MKHLILIPVLTAGLLATTSMSNTRISKEHIRVFQGYGNGVTEAEFPGGQQAMMQFVSTNVKYPQSSIVANEKGIVYVEFIVKKSGEIAKAKILKSTGFKALDDEALRIVNMMPNWSPATKNGKVVNSEEIQLPINFTFNN